MSSYTKAERHDIYRALLRWFMDYPTWLCHKLEAYQGITEDRVPDDLPELGAYKAEQDWRAGGGWFPNKPATPEGKAQRIAALKHCIEQTAPIPDEQ